MLLPLMSLGKRQIGQLSGMNLPLGKEGNRNDFQCSQWTKLPTPDLATEFTNSELPAFVRGIEFLQVGKNVRRERMERLLGFGVLLAIVPAPRFIFLFAPSTVAFL